MRLFSILLLVGELVGFSKVGTTAANFLKIGIDARACGMGWAYVALSEGAESYYWNPSGGIWLNRVCMKGGITNYILDTRIYDVGILYPLAKNLSINFGVFTLRSGKMEVNTINEPYGTGRFFEYLGSHINLSISQKLYDRLSYGLGVRYITESIYRENTQGLAINLGLRFYLGIKNTFLGMALTNFGESMKLDGEDLKVPVDPLPGYGGNPEIPGKLETSRWSLPTTFVVGMGLEPITDRLIMAIDGFHTAEGKEGINLGVEFKLNNLLRLRAGYRLIEEPGKLNFGSGIVVRKGNLVYQLDYSFQDLEILGPVHRVTLGIERI